LLLRSSELRPKTARKNVSACDCDRLGAVFVRFHRWCNMTIWTHIVHLPCSYTFHHTQHILHLTDGRLESTSAANALMLMLDKLKLPNRDIDDVEHEPFLVSRPEGSTRKMQSPKKAAPSSPHRLPGLYLHEVSKETCSGNRQQKACHTRHIRISA